MLKAKYEDKIEAGVHRGFDDKAKEYRLKVSSALIVDKDIMSN